MLQKLEKVACSKNYFKTHNSCSHSVLQTTPTNHARERPHVPFSNSNIREDVRTSGPNVARKHTGTSSLDPKFHIANVCNKEKQWRRQADFQPEGLKQVCIPKTISPVQSPTDAYFPAAWRLVDKIRSSSGLQPHANTPVTPPIFESKLSRKVVADDFTSVWPCLSTENVRLSNKLDSRGAPFKGDPSRSIPRRFLPSKSVPSKPKRSDRHDYRSTSKPGLARQLQKVRDLSIKNTRVSRRGLGHQRKLQIPATRKSVRSPSVPSPLPSGRQLDPQAGSTPLRETQLRSLHHPAGKAALPPDATPLSSSEEGSTNSVTTPSRSEIRDDMVATKCWRCIPHSPTTSSIQLPNYRCFRCGLGGTGKRRKIHGRMGESSRELALQSKRNVLGTGSDKDERTDSTRLDLTAPKRQPNRDSLHQTGRRNEIRSPSRSYDRASGDSRSPENNSVTTILTRAIQHRCRSPVSRPSQSGVAPTQRSINNNLPKMGHSKRRPVCVTRSTRSAKLRIARRKRLESLISQCIQQVMELRPGMDISATQSNTSGASPSESSLRSLHNSSSQVEETVLGNRPSLESSRQASGDQGLACQLDGHNDRQGTSTDQGPGITSLAGFGWETLLKEWTDQEKTLLEGAWRKSTLKTYRPIWAKWSVWCSQNNVDKLVPSPIQVARYLASLHIEHGLAYRTILLYKSVISSMCEPTCQDKISQNSIVKHLLKAISLAKPLPQKAPIWDARILINYLKQKSPNQHNLYEVSGRTAILLLLTSGRRVHDLTLLRCDPKHLIDNGSTIVLHPVFGSKTDSSKYQQSSWKVLSGADRNIDVVFWLRQLLIVSKTKREQKQLTELFISCQSICKPASPTMIGGWIRHILKDAGIAASPGSTRSAVSSLNWLEKYPINEILSRANWQHDTTFHRHYQRSIQPGSNIDSQPRSLSMYFEAI